MRRKPNKKLNSFLKANALSKTIDELLPIVNGMINTPYTRLELQKYLIRNRIQYKYTNESKSHPMGLNVPIGTERMHTDDMIRIKVSKNEWVYKQRYIYEQYYGVKLKEDEYVVFKDGDKTNFDISNLKCVSRYVASHLRNASHNKITRPLELLTYELKVKTEDKRNSLD